MGDGGLKLFADCELYTVAEIAKRTKCSHDTVDRILRRHGVPAVRFGARKFWGAAINKVIELETR
jgi:excisionase family DNA binding protein